MAKTSQQRSETCRFLYIYKIIDVVKVTIQQLNKDTSLTTILTLALVILSWRSKQDLPSFFVSNDKTFYYQMTTTNIKLPYLEDTGFDGK